MATLVTTPIKVFVSGETVTPTKLNELSQPTVALTAGTIVAADIASDAVTNVKIASGVDASKLTTGTLPADRIGSSAITTARINDAAVTAAKLDGAQTGSAPIYGCRAWVAFDGTAGSTVDGEFRCTIRGSGNVQKVVRQATGTFQIHFTTAMPNANYAVVGICGGISLGASLLREGSDFGAKTTARCFVATGTDTAFANRPNNDVFVLA